MVLFFTGWVEMEITALLILLFLLLGGILTPAEAFSGFSNPAVIVVAGLLVMSAAIERTGALQIVARRILRFSRHSPGRITVTLMLSTGCLSMFLNNTPTVAIQLPISIALAEKARMSLSKLLIPISFSAILGGTCTMIGTSTNVLVGSLAASHGITIGLFEITPMGLIYFTAGICFMLLAGRRLTPDRRAGEELAELYQLREYIAEFEVRPGSAWIGREMSFHLSLDEDEPDGVSLVEVIRGEDKLFPTERPVLRSGDLLLVHGQVEQLLKLREDPGLRIRHDFNLDDQSLQNDNILLVEGVLSPSSKLLGQTLQELDFRNSTGAVALALRRHGKILREKVGKVRLAFGDSLLLQGERSRIEKLMQSADFLFLEKVKLPPARQRKILAAIGIFLSVLLLMAAGLLDLSTGVVLGATLMLLTGCISIKELYESLSFKVILLMGCTIPLGLAMEKTGAADLLIRELLRLIPGQSPQLVLLALAAAAVLLTEVISNTATAVLLVPIAFAAATRLNVDPKPLVLAVMFSASFSFLTPIGYQTNTLIYGPGGYRFSDYARVGAPLTLILLGLTTVLIPWFWPF